MNLEGMVIEYLGRRFTWKRVERKPNVFEFGWFDDTNEHKLGVEVKPL